jgi:hypothetical protein
VGHGGGVQVAGDVEAVVGLEGEGPAPEGAVEVVQVGHRVEQVHHYGHHARHALQAKTRE